MKITVAQLKQLIRESFEPFVPELQGKRDEKAELYGLFSDMHKEKHGIRPHHVHPDHVSVEDLRARIEDLHNTPEQDYDDWGSDEYEAAERAELDAMDALAAERKAERDALGFEGQDEEGLPMQLGMGRGHGLEESLKVIIREMLEEAKKKPSAGLSKKKKSETVKAAKKGKDIGKKGKGFEDVAKKAGGGEKGKKIAAAAMWKNIKR